MARKFLYLIAILIVLVIAVLFALRIWSNELTRFVFVPREEFIEQPALQPNAYESPDMWFSRPGLEGPDPSRWQPEVEQKAESHPDKKVPVAHAAEAGADLSSDQNPGADAQDTVPDFAVFFVHPTSYLERTHWNAPLDDKESQDRATIFLQGLASPFAAAQQIWAPRYRQATFGAFLVDTPEAQKALDAAYRDVEQAFEVFLANLPENRPFVLAGHSQGARHIIGLLKEKVAETPLARRLIAAYPVGWPISAAHDLPGLGISPCEDPAQVGCLLTWSSFAEPADPAIIMERYSKSLGFDGEPRGDSAIVCVNPITGTFGDNAPASENIGTLVPDKSLKNGELKAGMVPARCDERGLLLIGSGPEIGPYVLPGNNYHVYDIPLFWKNVEQDVNRRARAWAQTH